MRGGKELTSREVEILELIKLGNGNREVASILGVTYGTVKNHLQTIFLHLGAADRTDAVVKAHKAGYINIRVGGNERTDIRRA